MATLFTLSACATGGSDTGEAPGPAPDGSPQGDNPNDVDGDGYEVGVDCNDNDPSIHPLAAERCDGVDQNCNDEIDEGALDGTTYYDDVDGDGYGDPETAVTSCSPLAGQVENGDDCYDDNSDAYPGQSAFFTVDRGDGSFDYDCSGNGESDTPVGNCSFNGSGCGYAQGWEDGAPACGASGDVITGCIEVCIGICICEADTDNQVNTCR